MAKRHVLPSHTTAQLPTAGTAGAVAWVTDGVSGVWVDTGTQWHALGHDIVSVKDYGAKGDGTTDDTTAFTTALAALPATGGIVIVPGSANPYQLTSLTITTSNIRIIGAGRSFAGGDGTAQSPARLRFTAGSGAAISIAGSVEVSNFGLENLEVIGNSNMDYGVRFLTPASGTKFAVHPHLLRVGISGFTKTNARGLSVEGGITGVISECYFSGNYDNAVFDGTNTTTWDWVNTTSRSATRYGLLIQNGAAQLRIVGRASVLESNGSQAIYVDTTGFTTYGLTFRDLWVGSNTSGGANYQVVVEGSSGSTRGLLVDGVMFADGVGAHDLSLNRVITGTVTNIIGAAAGGKNIVKLGANVEEIAILNVQDSSGGAVDPDNRAALSYPNSASGSNGLGLRVGTGLSDKGVGTINALTDLYKNGSNQTGLANPTYGASITPDISLGRTHRITATNGTAFTVNNPTNSITGDIITLIIRNTSGGALGVLTLGGGYKIGAAWTQPANGFSRSIQFLNDGTNWVEINRTAADVAN